MILAIDPGERTGLAIGAPGSIAAKTVHLPAGDGRRLAALRTAIDAVLFPLHERPRLIAYEAPFVGRFVSAARPLYHYEAVILLYAAQRGIPCAGYQPSEIKASLGIGGRAGKDRVTQRVRALGYTTGTDHEADAIALLLLAASGTAPARVRATATKARIRKAQRRLAL